VRIDQDQADSLFKVVKEALENNKEGIEFTPSRGRAVAETDGVDAQVGRREEDYQAYC
jgi:hypothetical protein